MTIQTSAKKQWQKPDFYLLDSDSLNAKVGSSHHEASATNKHITRSGHPWGKFGGGTSFALDYVFS